MTNQPFFVAIVPAAGRSSRFLGANKLVQPLGVHSMVAHVVRAAKEAGCDLVLVITGHQQDQISEALTNESVRIVHNDGFETGMGSSISRGVQVADEADGFLIWPADMPLVKPSTARILLDAFEPNTITLPVFDGKDGHPVLFPAAFRNELVDLPVERGARTILESHADSINRFNVTDPGIHVDIDSREDLNTVIQQLFSNL